MKALAITCGDPAGVGPEIVASWAASHPEDASRAVAIGPGRWLETLPSGIGKLAVGLEEFSAIPGKPDGDGALVAWAALERAASGCKSGEFSGVVTAPISKERLASIGWNFPGQTEFFAARWGGEPTMAFCGGKLRIVLLSVHIPLKEVPEALKPEAFARSARAATDLAGLDGIAAPRIGVCGLNPHAGEGGLLGKEEKETIDPILDALRSRYPGLSRTQPGDTVFARQLRGDFDVVIALYHDQGLAPLKAVDFDDSVNVTLGLPWVRTSPDHGTAFGIAGKGKANPQSFGNAVQVAKRLLQFRMGRG